MTIENQPLTGTRKKILVVDDTPIIIKTLSFKLKLNGYDVVTATDGAEAVGTVRREKPDLILLDLNFPADVAFGGVVSWDGFVIIDWLRRLKEGQNVPIFVITSDNSPPSDQHALNAGAVKVFHKPIDQAALLLAIRETLGSTASPQ
jgi:two-component system response regulator/two-component system chemotaxis response regulator CheY